MWNSAGPLALVGLILVGFAVLWARQLTYGNRVRRHQDPLRLMLSIGGSLLILVGVLGAAMHMTFILAPVAVVVVLMTALMLVMRYRALERRSLLKCVAIAAEKGIPLSSAVRGFANERTDELGYRALILAESLEAGASLPVALAMSKTSLPVEAMLAMRLGYETDTLSPAVSRIARPDESLDHAARMLYEKYLYLVMMLLVMGACISFFILKIAPVFEKMFVEFELALPTITRVNFAAADYFTQWWFLLLPLVVLALPLFVASCLQYVGFLPLDIPGTGWMTRRVDSALVMRCLALAISRQWPLNKTTWMLARIYPRRGMRSRLVCAGQWMDNGLDWCDSLRRGKVIGAADWAVIKAAQRAGNVEWALDEMADSSSRRLVYRLRLFLSIAFPVVLFLVGLLVAFFVVGFFLPLVSLIQGLA
jgi:type II secretory pathway component PulF